MLTWHQEKRDAWRRALLNSIWLRDVNLRVDASPARCLGTNAAGLLDGSNIASADYRAGYTILRLRDEAPFAWLPVGGLAFTWRGVIVIRRGAAVQWALWMRALNEECWHVSQWLDDPGRMAREDERIRAWGPLAALLSVAPLVLANPIEREAKLAKWTHLGVPNLHCAEAVEYGAAVRRYFERRGAEFGGSLVVPADPDARFVGVRL